MNIKNKNFFQYFKFSLFLYIFSTQTFAGEPFEFDDPLDGFAFNTQDIEHEPTIIKGSPSFSASFFFNETVKLENIVADHFYARTNPLRRRNISSLNFTQFPRYDFGKHFHGFLFYRQTYKAHYWQDKTDIKNYANMEQSHIVQTADVLMSLDPDVDPVDIPGILLLFENIKAQEHQLAFMLQYTQTWNEWNISFQAPLLYQINAFFLSDGERKRIKNSTEFAALAANDGDSNESVMDFAQKHLISDKLGFGDLQISFERKLKTTDLYELYAGMDVTVPTAFAVKKGLYGTSFDKLKVAGQIDLHADIIDPRLDASATDDEAEKARLQDIMKTKGMDFAEAILDRLSTMVIENNLGNDHHFSVGFFMRSTLNLFDNVTLISKTKVEVPLPYKEWRFIQQPITVSEVEAIAALPQTTDAESTIKFQALDDKIIQKFFPTAYRTNVFQGTIFQTNAKLIRYGENWNTFIGTDMWYQMKEKFISINTTTAQENLLDVDGAKRGYAFQNKIWFGIEKNRENSDWDLGLTVSTSGLAYGVGSDFSIAFTASREF